MGIASIIRPVTSIFTDILGNVGSDLGFGQPQTTTSTQLLPAYLQPYMKGLASSAYNLPTSQLAPVTPFAPETGQMFSRYRQLADAPSYLNPMAAYETARTLGGGYMGFGINPYLDQSLNFALDPLEQSIKSQFASAGRYGSAALGGELGRQLGGARTQAYQRDYEAQQARNQAERNRMMQAAQFAPQLQSAMDTRGIQQAGLLGQVGAQREAKQMEYLNQPYQALTRQANLIYPQAGFSGVTENYTPGGSPVAGLLGSLSAAAGAYKTFGG